MGKRQSLKEQGAVSVIHDGPIFREIENGRESSGAVLLVLTALAKTTEDPSASVSSQLLSNLLHTHYIKDQISFLQNFKSLIIQKSRRKMSSSGGGMEDEALPFRGLDKADWRELRHVYQVLLEWSLGYLSPLPLRRTIHSILETLYDLHPSKDALQSIFVSTMQSLFVPDNIWEHSLESLDSLLLLAQNRPTTYLGPMIGPTVSFLGKRARGIFSELQHANGLSGELGTEHLIADGVQVASIAKSLVQDHRVSNITDLSDISTLAWKLLEHDLTPSDDLPALGMCYGGCIDYGPSDECMHFVATLIDRAQRDLRPLPRISLMQGLASTVPNEAWVSLTTTSESDALRVFLAVFSQTARQAVDPEVRLAALKGSRTLARRSVCLMGPSFSVGLDAVQLQVMKKASDEVLETVLLAWENPPTKKMSNSLPPTFQAIVEWKEMLAQRLGEMESDDAILDSLVNRLLGQPPYRKGKYKALECILPKVGARRLLMPVDSVYDSNSLLSDLMDGIGDSGHNTGAMADLWAKLLQSLFVEAHQGLAYDSKPRGKTKKKLFASSNVMEVSGEWLSTWVPTLASSLLTGGFKRRKRVAAFCLPRVFTIVHDRVDACAQSFAALLNQIGKLEACRHTDFLPKDRETYADRVLWAKLEVLRYSTVEKKLMSHKGEPTQVLIASIASNIPMDRFREGLIHFSSAVRITSFQAMEGIVDCRYDSPTDRCLNEMELWKYSLVYASKEDAKEYIAILLFRLLSFLDRLSRLEAEAYKEGSPKLPNFCRFVNDFLIDTVIVKHSTYPASVVTKETFSFALLRALLIYSCRDLKIAVESNILPKSGPLYDRRRSKIEDEALGSVRVKLLSFAVVGSLISSLQTSTWEGTKAKSFELLATLIAMARDENVPLPKEFFSSIAYSRLREWALNLASSPRQREADTGARVLAILGLSLPRFAAREKYVDELTSILGERLQVLKNTLELVLKPGSDIVLGNSAVLVHGIILALRLIVESDGLIASKDNETKSLDRLARILCSGMQISLAVVADVRDGEDLEGVGEDITSIPVSEVDYAQVKVNPGAIGANGIFSSVSRINTAEHERRLASQRIIVGSWLLMREACAAIAAVMTKDDFEPSLDLSNLSGTLLISTLTSLKHTGAAFAAHSALQRIAMSTLDRVDTKAIPLQWIERLFREILCTDKIRDSTLRRSTGYALGFLAVMRPEVSLRPVPRAICARVTREILMATLPSPRRLEDFLSTVQLDCQEEPACIFSYMSYPTNDPPILTQNVRSRVHALNVLRMLILDAPLAKEVFPLVGDAIVSAVIGYVDSEWSIRNSAGMVFSAAMLRVIDADKNAANVGATSKNAITLSELFQSYPALCDVLFAVLGACVNGSLKVDGGGSLPPILPILVLFYRVQPLESCDPIVVGKMQKFDSALLACLRHRHLRVRQAAAKALCNLAGGEATNPLSVGRLFDVCIFTLRSHANWNHLHGAILLLKELRTTRKLAQPTEESPGEFTPLFGLLAVSSQGIIAPPICLADAIKVIETANDSLGKQYSLLQCCLQLISWLSVGTEAKMEVPGMSELAPTATRVAVRSLVNQVLTGQSANALQTMGHLSNLLEHDCIDIRLPAVKQFKKLIHNALGCLVERAAHDDDNSVALQILGALAHISARALKLELSRSTATTSNMVVPHPPTLRRLSRCLLDVDMAHYLVHHKGCLREKEFGLWEIGVSILDHKRDDAEEPTPLVGNALELLASDFRSEHSDLLWPLLDKLSCPSLPWRLRYSSACAVSILWRRHIDLRLHLRYLVCRLLQDEDPDARYSIAKAVRPDQMTSLSVPENVLTKFIQAHIGGIEDGLVFMKGLVERAQKDTIKLQELVRERDSDAQRKIFEEEDPNSYHEPALSDQASLSCLWDTLSTETSLSEYHVRLGELTVGMLSILTGRPDADHLCSVLFGTLHILLLVSAAAPTFNTLTKAAKQFLVSVDCTLLHPILSSALQLVAHRTEQAVPWAEIKEFCFLLVT